MNKSLINNKFIKSIFHLGMGTLVSSILGLINTAFLISVIGMKDNGMIFLAQSYVTFFNTLLNFQSYEAIIKFLPNHTNNSEEGKNYITLGILIDISTAIIGFLVAIILLNTIVKVFAWDTQVKQYIQILIPTILLTITGSFSGILRIYNKFNYIAISQSSNSVMTFILYIIGYTFKLDTAYYVMTFVVVRLLVTVLDTIFTYKTLKENNMHKLSFKKIEWNKEFIKFAISANICSTLDLPVTHLVPIIINQYLGLSEISVYKVLEKLGGVISICVGVINQITIPEISKRIANNDVRGAFRISNLLKVSISLVGVCVLVGIAFTKEWWLGIFIPTYESYIIAIYLYFICIIYISAFSGQNPIFVFAGFVKYNIYILILVNTIYLIILVYMTKYWGLNGLILSRIIQCTMIFTIKAILLKLFLNRKINVEVDV